MTVGGMGFIPERLLMMMMMIFLFQQLLLLLGLGFFPGRSVHDNIYDPLVPIPREGLPIWTWPETIQVSRSRFNALNRCYCYK